MPGHTGVEARISAAATMLVTRLGTTHEGGTCVGQCSNACCRLADGGHLFQAFQLASNERP